MSRRWLPALVSLAAVATAAWVGKAGSGGKPETDSWVVAAPGVLRTPHGPAGYALVEGDRALLIDAPSPASGLGAHGVKAVDAVLLTHHHRDACAAAPDFLARSVPVRASREAAAWLRPENVRKYWQEAIPLRNSRTAYLVTPAGFPGVQYDLQDGLALEWRGWTIGVVATPGHSRDHIALSARRGKEGKLLLFCGDALAAPGKLWTPYTTDWDHWTDAGLTPAAQSLRRLATLQPDLVLPAHGPVIARDATAALEQTAAAVEEIAFLKSFERYTKKRLGNAPAYRFLAPDQVASGGEKPWTQVAEHLFLTGNTYVLTSKDNAFLVVDPWGKRSAEQIARLAADRKLGPLEVVLFSHAHHDHYDGIYELPGREKFQVWTLDRVGGPIADPFWLRAPFLDARPVKIDRLLADSDTASWREYRFRFHHLPGQSEFTMGIETTIDGKRCYFTADNFFHQDQFSGTGGWMGLNRSYPLPYAASARKVLDAAPEWVLAEHGGPFEFSAEDFRRRVAWGKEAARAADVVCPSGNHVYDWNPHRVHVEPLLQKARPGALLQATLVVDNPLARGQKLTVVLEGRGLTADQTLELNVPPAGTVQRALSFRLGETVPPGRHIFALQASAAEELDGSDAFVAVDVAP
jgi:glyoxylase-like metal-dependent hydrolase (beta-lactamase superfamily II)